MMRGILAAGLLLAASSASAAEGWMTKAVDLLRQESKIVEVLFNQGSARSLWISMQDDGSRRDGFAEYACIILHDAGMPVGGFTVIHIFDAAAMAAGHVNEIGRFDCERAP